MKRKTRTILAVLAVVSVIACFMIGGALGKIKSNLASLAELTIEDVDLAQIEDGIYTGEFEMMPLAVKVEVHVAEHTITEINLVEYKHGRGEQAKVIPEKVIEAQSLKVDVVSGATYSSKAMLKAIQNALLSAGK